jgi:hypothetical protein
MFSKIGAMVGPSSQGGRGSGQDSQSRRQDSGVADDANTAPEDIVMLSIGALRALVQEELSLQPQAQELLRKLSMVEQHGLQNLPVRAGQPVGDAILEAASYFGSAR